MSSRVRLLGLAFFAALALAAVGAVAASAGTYDSEIEVTEITGNNTEECKNPVEGSCAKGTTAEKEETYHVFTAGLVPVTCKMVTATGKITGTFKEAKVYTTNAVTATPEYTLCDVAGTTATVNMNGCDYNFLAPTQNTTTTFTVKSIEIKCPSGKKIEVTVAGVCTISVGPQTTTGTSTLHNKGEGTKRDVTLEANVSNIQFTSTGGICGTAGTFATGNYKGKVTIKGYKDAAHKEQVGVFVTGP